MTVRARAWERAAAHYRDALANQAIAFVLGITDCLEHLGEIGSVHGDAAQAAHRFGVVQQIRTTIGAPRIPVNCPAYDDAVAAIRAPLGDDAFAAAMAAGATLPMEQVIEELLGENPSMMSDIQ